jgi:hypothetical protein
MTEIKSNQNHGGKRAGSGRKRLDIQAERERQRFQQPDQAEYHSGLETPLAYMLRVMSDPGADWKRRDEMAKAAAPYCHRKMADSPIGKKEQAQAEAETAGEGSDWGTDLLIDPSIRN